MLLDAVLTKVVFIGVPIVRPDGQHSFDSSTHKLASVLVAGHTIAMNT